MPNSTVKTTAPGVENPYGTYTELYTSHRMSEMYSDAKNDYSVKGGSSTSANSSPPPKKDY